MPTLLLDLAHSLWEVHLTFDEDLAMPLCREWYPPFVRRPVPPFVVPVSVSLSGALVGNHLLAGSMHGMGSRGRLVPPDVLSCRLILLETT